MLISYSIDATYGILLMMQYIQIAILLAIARSTDDPMPDLISLAENNAITKYLWENENN